MLRTCAIGLLAWGLMMFSPCVIFWVHSKKQKHLFSSDKTQTDSVFGMPSKLWLLTLQGFLVSLSLCCILCLPFLFLAMRVTNAHWAILMIVFFIYWLAFAFFLPAMMFFEHKDDYICFREGKLGWMLKRKAFEIPYDKLQKVVRRRGEFSLHTADKEKHSFPDNVILRLEKSDELLKQLQAICR